MTIVLRPRASLFHAEGGWFSANWHFSFDQYWDEANMGIGDLRVFNDDRLVPGAAWPMHPHRDIEGITYVAEGTFEHADSRGNGGILHPGAVQRATLGSGMQHSERNGSKTEPMRFIQMWILPAERGLDPGVEQRVFTADDRTDRLLKVISADGGDAVLVHQDAHVFVSRLNAGVSVDHELGSGRGAYLYVIEGDVAVNGEAMATGDAAQITGEPRVEIRATVTSELILVDVAL